MGNTKMMVFGGVFRGYSFLQQTRLLALGFSFPLAEQGRLFTPTDALIKVRDFRPFKQSRRGLVYAASAWANGNIN